MPNSTPVISDDSNALREQLAAQFIDQLKTRATQYASEHPDVALGLAAGTGGLLGAGIGGAGGALMGLGRRNTPEGLGRGIIRGGATGAGSAFGMVAGPLLANRYGFDPRMGAVAGGGIGGLMGNLGTGLIMGAPSGRAKTPEAKSRYDKQLRLLAGSGVGGLAGRLGAMAAAPYVGGDYTLPASAAGAVIGGLLSKRQ